VLPLAVLAVAFLAACSAETVAAPAVPAASSSTATSPWSDEPGSGPDGLTVGPDGEALPHPTGSYVSIPSSTNRAPDPGLPDGYQTGDRLDAAHASLNQIWGLVASSFDDAQPSVVLAESLRDFADAIETRCFPQLSPGTVAELQSLRGEFESASGDAGSAPARAYFDRASALCM
jgi:hypothetical protein